MRYKEFLFEYRRDVTAQKMGDKLISSFHAKENGHSLPSRLYGAWTVVDMVLRPKFHFEDTIKMDVLGQITTINKEIAPQVLQQIKPALVDAILAELETSDPTPHKEYTQWVAARYITGDTKLEDIGSTLAEYLYKFNILKRKKILKPPANDINRYPSFSNFMDNMDEYALPEDEITDKGKSTEVYVDANVRVIVPEDESAACYYGRGTRWCTAATQGTNYFNHYNRQGPMYIILPKHPAYDGEKYQLHFPSEQYMDPSDEPIDLPDVLAKFNLITFFKQQEPTMHEYVNFAEDKELKPLLDKIKEYAMDFFWEEELAWQDQDDGWHNWRAEQARERGLVDEYDDIDWDKVAEEDDLNDYMKWNDDMRSWYNAVDVALSYSPNSIRHFLENDQDGRNNYGDQSDLYKISQLDELMARIVRYETGNNDDSVANDIERGIAVRPDNNRINKSDPLWTVRRVGR